MAARAADKPVAVAPQPNAPVALPDGSVEVLKWLALVLMVLDHVNTHLLGSNEPWMFATGRIVMPVFSLLLAYNLARGRAGAAWRTSRRTLAFGVLGTPAFWALHGGWWPLNILFTLSAAAAVIALLQQHRTGAALLLGWLAGFVVEFWWPAIGATVAAWYWWRSPTWRPALLWVLCMLALTPVNGNAWALAAVPVVATAAALKLHAARMKWIFYIAYPLHLTIIWSLR